MLVIGIDPGIAITGYGLVREAKDGSLQVVDYGAVVTPPKTPLPDRLNQLFHSLNDVLARHNPESAAVEKLFFQKNVRTAMTVGQARGVALLSLSEAKIPVSDYTPNEVKLAVAGYGGADKRQVQEMVRTLLDLSELPKPDDAADALAVAICHLHSSRTTALFQQGSRS
jgi:crossover junction endodeoxyribonuclease RuvC